MARELKEINNRGWGKDQAFAPEVKTDQRRTGGVGGLQRKLHSGSRAWPIRAFL